MGLVPNKLRRRSVQLQAIPIRSRSDDGHPGSDSEAQIEPLPKARAFSPRPSTTFYSPSSINTFVTSREEPAWNWDPTPIDSTPSTASSVIDRSISHPAPISPTSTHSTATIPTMSYSNQPSSPRDYGSPQGYSQRPQSQSFPSGGYPSQGGQPIPRPHSGQGSINSNYDRRFPQQQSSNPNNGQSYGQGVPPPPSSSQPPPNNRGGPSAPSSGGYPSQTSSPNASTPSFANQRPNSQMFPASQSQRSLSTTTGGSGAAAAAGGGAPNTIAGEPLHDMERAIALLKSSKFYAEGAPMSSRAE